MHASRATHFIFLCTQSLIPHFLARLLSNSSHSFTFPYLSHVCFFWLAACGSWTNRPHGWTCIPYRNPQADLEA